MYDEKQRQSRVGCCTAVCSNFIRAYDIYSTSLTLDAATGP